MFLVKRKNDYFCILKTSLAMKKEIGSSRDLNDKLFNNK